MNITNDTQLEKERHKAYGSFTLHGTGTGTGKWWVSILHYVQYTLHRDRDRYRKSLFSIVSIPFPVPVPVPSRAVCTLYDNMSQGLLGLCCSIETRDRNEIITLTAALFE